MKELQYLVSLEKKLEVRLGLYKKMIKLKFQHCAILSQINEH